MRVSASLAVVLLFAGALPAQTVSARVEGRVGTATVLKVRPPAGDLRGDSLPPFVAPLFAEPRPISPHFDFARFTFSDMCYCLASDADYASAASKFDLVMSGNLAKWRAANPAIEALRYALMQTTLTEEPDTTGQIDQDGITGKWQYDARQWFAAHPKYDYESMWLHDTTSGTPADSAHRLRRLIWKNYRYAINPMDPGARAYTIDRLRRAEAEVPGATGLFLDEMDHNALGWPALSREGRAAGTQAWQDSTVTLVGAVRAAVGRIQTNAAGYSRGAFDARVGMAGGYMHLELMNLATQEQPGTWTFIDSLVAIGIDVGFATAETWTDMLRTTWLTNYPGGNYALPVYRAKVAQLASYYMVVDSGARQVSLQIDNTRGITPDSTWLPIYQLDVGYPLGARSLWLDERDALSQRARVYRRDFSRAIVLYRPVAYWGDKNMRDTTAVAVPLPTGGPWSMVLARGQVVPLDSLQLRNGEGAFLVRRQ